MGSSSSQLLPVTDGSPRTHCIVAFPARFCNDEILLMYGVHELKHVFEGAVHRSWTKGLQKVEEKQNELVLFKLRGNPFHAGDGIGASLTRSVANTRFLVALLEDLMRSGWVLRAMVNFLRESKTESMVLARSQPESLKSMIGAVALCSSDMISLVNLPRHLHDTLVHLTEKHWPQGIKSMKHFNHEEDFGLVTKRWPFRSTDIGPNLHNCRMLLLNLIRAIYEVGYEFYGSGHPGCTSEAVGTLFFQRVESSKCQSLLGMFLMAPHLADTIITVDASDSCVEILRQCIRQNWSKQIQRENSHDRLHAIKMKGNPFWTSGAEAVESVRVIIHTLEQFRRAGYRLAGTFDAMTCLNDTSTFLLVQDAPKDITLMAVRLSGTQNLILINAPAEVENAVRDELHKTIVAGVKEKSVNTALKFVLNRNLWNAQTVICNVIARIEAYGWCLVSSADLNSKYVQTEDSSYPWDLHTMFFERI